MTSKARGKEDLPLVEVNSHANHHVRLGRNLLKEMGRGWYRMLQDGEAGKIFSLKKNT
jgi:hypothetical protein